MRVLQNSKVGNNHFWVHISKALVSNKVGAQYIAPAQAVHSKNDSFATPSPRLYILKTAILQHPRLSNANCYGLESYHRLGGRNLLRPYFVVENQCFGPKLVTLQYIAPLLRGFSICWE